ncbi:MAG: sigma-70 family RNA polymerase sigma factor [Thermoanaerobaculia bacterium]|nr:sigma-70 family RNA polymerase sigma factor [Thermoanaerobaculia bacterium]
MANRAEAPGAPAELARRIAAGDHAAEAELVDHFGRGVRVLVRHLTHDGARADDLFQETFRLAIEKIRAAELREPERLAAFLAGLARNLAIADFRRQRAHPATELDAVPEPEAAVPDPLDTALRRDEARRVRQLLAELEPERDRQVLFRFYLAEEPKERICADLGLSSLHFNRVVHRARERFRQLLLAKSPPPLGFSNVWGHSSRRGEPPR